MTENEQEKSKPGRDYSVPDVPAPTPDDEEKSLFVLELYAREIREHAGGILSVRGLSPAATTNYKRKCFEAAGLLEDAAGILRNNGGVRNLRVIRKHADLASAEEASEAAERRVFASAPPVPPSPGVANKKNAALSLPRMLLEGLLSCLAVVGIGGGLAAWLAR